MARIRTIKPEIVMSESLAALDAAVVLTFVFLWPFCDDRGRYPANPTLVRAAVAPLRDLTDIEIATHIHLLTESEKLCTYRACDDKVYLHVVNWDEHQKIDKPSRPIYPACRDHEPDAPCSRNKAHECRSRLASVLDAKAYSTSSRGARETVATVRPSGLVVPPRVDLPWPSRDTREAPANDLVPRTLDLVPSTDNTAPRNAAPTSATRRGTRIPDDFAVTDEMRTWAHDRGWTDAEIDHTTEEFVDYWQALPGARATKLDWVKTWRNRLRDQERHRRVRSARPTTSDKVADGLDVARRLASEGR